MPTSQRLRALRAIEMSKMLESNFLFLSTGQTERMKEGIAPYRNASEELGVSRGGWGWDVRLADFDNDGILEVIHAAGFTKGIVSRWPEMHEWALMNSELTVTPRSWHHIERFPRQGLALKTAAP